MYILDAGKADRAVRSDTQLTMTLSFNPAFGYPTPASEAQQILLPHPLPHPRNITTTPFDTLDASEKTSAHTWGTPMLYIRQERASRALSAITDQESLLLGARQPRRPANMYTPTAHIMKTRARHARMARITARDLNPNGRARKYIYIPAVYTDKGHQIGKDACGRAAASDAPVRLWMLIPRLPYIARRDGYTPPPLPVGSL